MTWIEENLGKWVIKHRWWVIILTVITVLTTAHGTRFLTFNNDTRIFFSEDNPQLQALEELENTYNRIDNVVFIVAPKDGDVFTRSTLSMLEELTEASWKIPHSSRVDSITNFQHARAEEDDLIVEDLFIDSGGLSDQEIDRKKQIALSEPLLINNLISPAGHVTGVNVNVLLPGTSAEEVPEVAAYVNNMADDFRRKYPDINIYLTGVVMFDHAFSLAAADDMTTLIPAMLLVVIILIGLTLRSFSGTFATLVIILFSMGTGIGIAGWLGMSLNPASANAPTIIMVLAVADSVHLMATMFQQMRRGRTRHEAIVESLRVNLQPVFLTSLTTTIGFMTMNFSDAPPFRELGNIVSMGVISAFIYSIFFLPALLAVIPVKVKPKSDNVSANNTSLDWIADFVINRRRPLFWAIIVFIAVMTAGLTRIELHDDWIKYFDDRYDIRTATDFGKKNLTGYSVIEYSLDSGSSGGINDPVYLNKVENFVKWYHKQPKVIHINAITYTYKRLNKNMHGDDETFYRIPGRRDLAAQYLLLYEMSLPFGLDLNNYINVDKSATRMIVTFRGTTTTELREIDVKAREWLTTNAPDMFTYGSGLSIIWAHISQRNINSMLGASFGALALISCLMIIALRSFKLGLLSLIPNLSPAFMAFGLWGIVQSQVGLGLSVVVAMTLGIVVDDTVHFMSKYLRARQYKMDPKEAVRYSFHTVGTAIWITTVALVAGFTILTFSGFKMNSEMGLLTAITITLALFMDFLFLPVLLMKADRR